MRNTGNTMLMRHCFAALLFLFSGCWMKTISPGELQQFVDDPENELKVSANKGNVSIQVLYRPKELVFLPRVGDDQIAWKKQLAEVDSLDYFLIRLSRGGKEIENALAGDEKKFSDLVSYLSLGIAQDLTLVNAADTLAPLDVMYSRTFGASEATSVMVIFKSHLKTRSGVATLRYQDHFLSTGLSEFTFSTKNIKSIPSIKFPL